VHPALSVEPYLPEAADPLSSVDLWRHSRMLGDSVVVNSFGAKTLMRPYITFKYIKVSDRFKGLWPYALELQAQVSARTWSGCLHGAQADGESRLAD
jgi:hypothetical protein